MTTLTPFPLPPEPASSAESRIILVAQPHPTEPDVTVVVPYDEKQHWWASKRVKPAAHLKDQVPLEYCNWHSHPEPGVPRTAPPESRCYIVDPSAYAVWTSNFECYDLCWIEAKKRREKLAAVMRHNFQLLDEVEATDARITAAMTSFNAIVAARDDLQRRLAQATARIEAKKRPTMVDPTRQARESIVQQNAQTLERALAQAETRWKAALAASPGMPSDEASRLRFINDIHYVADAKERLAKAQDALQNWINKSLNTQQKAELSQLTDLVQNLTVQIDNANRTMQKSAETPFYELYRTLKDYRQLEVLSVESRSGWVGIPWQFRDKLTRAKENLVKYRDAMITISEYVPRSEWPTLYARLRAEQDEAKRAAAAIAVLAKQTMTQIGTNSQLGQLVIDQKGNVMSQSASTTAAMPAVIVSARVTAIEQPVRKIEEEFEIYEEYDRREDYVGEDYESYYSGGKKEFRSSASAWRKTATRAPTARRRK